MDRGSSDDHSFAKYNSSAFVVTATIEGDSQRQKKRLSFKDPEIEPRQNLTHKPLQSSLKHSSIVRVRDFQQVSAAGLEDHSLEDQALQVVKNVGKAFIRPPRDPCAVERSTTLAKDTPITVEEKGFTDRNIEENRSRSTHKYTRKPDDVLNKFAAPPTPPAMRCPIIEIATEDDDKAAGGAEEEEEEQQRGGGTRETEGLPSSSKNAGLDSGWPTSARHQIQLLNLQLEQQRQQTQTAMSQMQLLKDQLEAEGSARYQAQIQNQQLMNQNKGLVNKIQELFQQIQDLEHQVEQQKNTRQQSSMPAQEPKQVTLAPPGLSQCGYRRNSATLWSNTLGLMGRRNSATVSPTPQQEPSDSAQKQFLGDSFSRRTSISDDLAAASRFSGITDWRLRRRGSSTLTLDFPAKSKINSANGINAADNPSFSPIDRTKITPLFSPDSKLGTMQSVRPRTEQDPGSASSAFKNEPSLAILDSPSTEYATAPSLSSSRSFKPIEPADQCSPSYPKKQSGREQVMDNQSRLAKSLETLRLFDS